MGYAYKITHVEQKEICDLYSNGMSITHVAERMGYSRPSVRDVLKKYKIPLRTREEQMAINKNPDLLRNLPKPEGNIGRKPAPPPMSEEDVDRSMVDLFDNDSVVEKEELSDEDVDEMMRSLEETLGSTHPDMLALRKSIRQQRIKANQDAAAGKPPEVPKYIRHVDPLDKQFANGEQFTKCAECGTVFEQDYKPYVNRYSDFKTCHSCRNKKAHEGAKKKGEEVAYVVSSLSYKPYPWQKKFHKDMQKKRFACIAAGARAG